MRNFAISTFLILASCATASLHIAKIEFSIFDNKESGRIEISFENKHGKSVCLGSDVWPSAAGKIDQIGGRVAVVIDDERFPMSDFEEYCPKGCVYKVKPGEIIVGIIPYDEFNIPEHLKNKDKILELRPVGYFCK